MGEEIFWGFNDVLFILKKSNENEKKLKYILESGMITWEYFKMCKYLMILYGIFFCNQSTVYQ